MKKIILLSVFCITVIICAIVIPAIVRNNDPKPGKNEGNCFQRNSTRIILTREDGEKVIIEGEGRNKIVNELTKQLDNNYSERLKDDSTTYNNQKDCPIYMDFDNGWGEINVSMDESKWMMSECYNNNHNCYWVMDEEIHKYIVELYLNQNN